MKMKMCTFLVQSELLDGLYVPIAIHSDHAVFACA